MSTEVLFSPACERNKDVILENLKDFCSDSFGNFLEIGFGTGQHAFHFAQAFPNLSYFIADREQYHPSFLLKEKVESKPANIKGPYSFEATDSEVKHNIESLGYDFLFVANVFHIMSWPQSQLTLNFLPSLMNDSGLCLFYGPFKFEGQFTSDSNQMFDQSLKASEPAMGIRDFESVESIMKSQGMELLERRDLPANNNLLIFKKTK